MFRKRHVQIGPVALTMARNDALSFYGKDRHVRGYWVACVVAQTCRGPVRPHLLKSGACGG